MPTSSESSSRTSRSTCQGTGSEPRPRGVRRGGQTFRRAADGGRSLRRRTSARRYRHSLSRIGGRPGRHLAPAGARRGRSGRRRPAKPASRPALASRGHGGLSRIGRPGLGGDLVVAENTPLACREASPEWTTSGRRCRSAPRSSPRTRARPRSRIESSSARGAVRPRLPVRGEPCWTGFRLQPHPSNPPVTACARIPGHREHDDQSRPHADGVGSSPRGGPRRNADGRHRRGDPTNDIDGWDAAAKTAALANALMDADLTPHDVRRRASGS